MTMGTSMLGLPRSAVTDPRVSRRQPGRRQGWSRGPSRRRRHWRSPARPSTADAGASSRCGSGGWSGWVGEPLVDEALDDPAAAERAADVGASALGAEVLLRAGRRPGSARGRARPRHRPRRSAIGDALGVGDLGQDEEGPDALLGAGPELGVQLGVGLLDRLEVGLLGDPLPGERAAELVVHHLDLLVDQDVRELDGRVGDGIIDDLVGELVARAVEGVALEAGLDIGAQRREVGEVAERADEVGVELGQDLLAQLAELDREVGRLAGQLGLAGSRPGR